MCEARRITRILSAKYGVDFNTAREATFEAYSQIEHVYEEEYFIPYWYVSSRNQLFLHFRRQKKNPNPYDPYVIEEVLPAPGEEEKVIPKEKLELTNDMIDKLEKKLTSLHFSIFMLMKKGADATVIAEELGIDRDRVYRSKKAMIMRCQEILGLI